MKLAALETLTALIMMKMFPIRIRTVHTRLMNGPDRNAYAQSQCLRIQLKVFAFRNFNNKI